MNDMTDIGLDIESFFYDMFLDDPLSLFITIIEVIAIILVIIRFRNSKKQAQRLEEQQKNLMMLKLTQELTNPRRKA